MSRCNCNCLIKNPRQFIAGSVKLSGNTYLRMMVEAKARGWQVNLIYVGMDDVQTCIERVAQRVATGGHNVPQEDIRRRSTLRLANLLMALQQADSTSIFDNSTLVGYQKLLTIENGEVIERASELPEWIRTLLL